jgi:hypothetical protein
MNHSFLLILLIIRMFKSGSRNGRDWWTISTPTVSNCDRIRGQD